MVVIGNGVEVYGTIAKVFARLCASESATKRVLLRSGGGGR